MVEKSRPTSPKKESHQTAVPFSFHPRVFAALGADLVTSDLVAVIELVKNCYDAFATRVDVRFKTGEDGKMSLEIEDNGVGMTDAVIRDVWCVVATPFRNKNVTTTFAEKERRVSGAKGLGRLAAARLGESMELITKQAGKKCWKVAVSWSELAESSGMNSCFAYLSPGEPTELANRTGTLLRISGLHNDWTELAIDGLEEGLSRLKPPFAELGDFKIFLKATDGSERPTEIRTSRFINSPTYLIKGKYSSSGSLQYEYRFKGLNGKKRWTGVQKQDWQSVKDDLSRHTTRHVPVGDSPTCGAFTFEIRAWDLDKESVQKAADSFDLQRSRIRAEIRAFKGLSVYRDQILVLPKSETARDWLGLDLRRVSKTGTRISTSQIVGYVGITGDDNAGIQDTSDRERFVRNMAAKDFEVLLYHVIDALEMERDKDRETRAPDPVDLFSGISASDIVAEAKQASAQGADADEIINLVESLERRLEGTRKQVEQHFTYYSRLATLGTLAAMLVHEIGNKRLYLQSFVGAVQSYLAKPETGLANVKRSLKYAEEALAYLQRLAQVFYPLAGQDFKRGKRTASISAVVDMCHIAHEKSLKERNVRWDAALKGPDSVNMDPAELHAVLQNLIDNSMYWVSRKNSGDRQILIETRKSPIADRVQVFVHDSGAGVAEDDQIRIFSPGYTRRPNGAGMGLTVAGEIVSAHQGELRLSKNGKLGGATFDFTLPIAAK